MVGVGVLLAAPPGAPAPTTAGVQLGIHRLAAPAGSAGLLGEW